MCKLLRVGILITIGIPIICIIRGCADDAPTEDVMAFSPLEGVAVALSPPPAHTVKVHPDPCIPVFPDTQFALTFDAGVDAASVNDTPATGAGRNWMVMPGLEVGTARLNIEWFKPGRLPWHYNYWALCSAGRSGGARISRNYAWYCEKWGGRCRPCTNQCKRFAVCVRRTSHRSH